MKLLRRVRTWLQPQASPPPSQQVLFEIHQEISQAVSKGYDNSHLKTLYASVPVPYLLQTAVKMYVGSTSCPRNLDVVKRLLRQSQSRDTEQAKLNVKYYECYLKRLTALQEGNQRGFVETSDQLLELASKHHPTACHVVGVELYKAAKNSLDPQFKKERLKMIEESTELLSVGIEQGSYYSYYTLGCMHEQGDITPQKDMAAAFDCFMLAASFDVTPAFFKLSQQYYRQGLACPKDDQLYIYYLKKAAEKGVLEAMHNLAYEYMQGQRLKKDDLKALAWYLHAGEHGFVHSKYNAAMLLLNGSECGRLRPNPEAALAKFEQLRKQGDIDVGDIMQKIIQKLGYRALEQQPQKN